MKALSAKWLAWPLFLLAMAAAQQDEGSLAKELEKSRESAQEAVKKGREAQEKLSISENIRKAEEKKKKDTALKHFNRLVLPALGIVLVARIWSKKKAAKN